MNGIPAFVARVLIYCEPVPWFQTYPAHAATDANIILVYGNSPRLPLSLWAWMYNYVRKADNE